jgi:serine O-acetyltransferase
MGTYDSLLQRLLGELLNGSGNEYRASRRRAGKWLPNPLLVKEVVPILKDILFPGYYRAFPLEAEGQQLMMRSLLLMFHRRLRELILCCFSNPADEEGLRRSTDLSLRFIQELPRIQEQLKMDVEAMYRTDPAASCPEEVILCYPSIEAMIHYRAAHLLHRLGVPLLPRMITELGHSSTGIDIHPAARIGEAFCIDHGTGVVIGETAVIGHHVSLYKGVTLGAKNFTLDEHGLPLNTPRHPVIEDHVVIYSNATILGRITIGHHSVIGGNIWLTHSVPPFSRITQFSATGQPGG